MLRYIFVILSLTSVLSSFSQNWQTLGNGLDFMPRDLYIDTASNRLYAIGAFNYADDTVLVNQIAYWDGVQWNDLDSGNTECPSCAPITGITTYQGNVYVYGQFTSFHNVPNTKYMARYNGTNWESIGTTNGGLWIHYYNNQLLVTGYFDTIGGVYAKNFALYDGVNWTPFDTSSFLGVTDAVYCAAEYNGELYVGGNFTAPNGLNEIARWDGTQWVSVGGGVIGGWVSHMLVYKNELYVAGNFNKSSGNAGTGIMKWNGSNWSELNNGLTFAGGAQIKDMVIYNNELIFVGFPLTADGIPVQNIVKWDGNNWCNFRNDYRGSAESVEVYNNELIVGCRDTMDADTVKWIAKWVGGNQSDTCGAIVDINENEFLNNNLLVYPNPTQNTFTIELENLNLSHYFSLFDIFGKTVLSQQLNSKKTKFDVGDLSKGIYFYEVNNSKQKSTGKLIVQ